MEASQSEVESVWVTGSSRSTGRVWWPQHMRRLSRPCPTLWARSVSHSLSLSPTHTNPLFYFLTETDLCPSFLQDPHEDHAGSHVQAPHRPGDAHVHINPVLPGTRCQDVELAIGPRRNQAGPRPDWGSPGAGVSVSYFSW